MIRIRIEKVKEFKTLISAIAKLIDTATFRISPGEFKLNAMDPTHVCSVRLFLEDSWFPEMICRESQQIALPLNNLENILKTSDDETLFLTQKLHERPEFYFKTDAGSTRSFHLNICPPEEEPGDPDLHPTVEFSISPSNLEKIIKSSILMGDYIEISMSLDSKTLLTHTQGDNGDSNNEFSEFSKAPVGGMLGNSTYSLEFLKDIIAANPIAENITIALAPELPIQLTFHLRDHGELIYILAPRVEEEMEEDLLLDDELIEDTEPEEQSKKVAKKTAKKKKKNAKKPEVMDWSLPDLPDEEEINPRAEEEQEEAFEDALNDEDENDEEDLVTDD